LLAGSSAAGRGYARTMPKKILALVSEPVSGEALKMAVAIERADEVQEETVERMEEEGVDAAGDQQNWGEAGLVDEARERFGKPVEHLVVERS
jgi:hypothetical protein